MAVTVKTGNGFPKTARLLTPSAFRAVTGSGRKSVSSCFLLFVQEVSVREASGRPPSVPEHSGSPTPRIGLTVSRKVGNAVVRNRVKRTIREFFRQHRHRLPAKLDAVVIARPRSGRANAAVLRRDLHKLFSNLALPEKTPRRAAGAENRP